MVGENTLDTSSAEELLDQLMAAAEAERASDIHIDPRGGEVLVRFRSDGILKEVTRFDITILEALNSKLKVLTQLDITNHTTPQEGHFEWASMNQSNAAEEGPRVMDVRLSTFPTIYGEAIVMRILNRAELIIPLPDLGFSANDKALMDQLLAAPYGMVLATGPAGSGKTTLMYAILNTLLLPEKNIITLEDPVEYHFKNIRQSQIHPERNYTFESGMRSILRQDPDIIMIGEIRDPTTVQIAIEASLTGRLLFSTLHANSTVGTIARLVDMQIDPTLIAYALNGIVAQRLVRRICQKCKAVDNPDPSLLQLFGLKPGDATFMKGTGCAVCNDSGYDGRIGIFEILVIDNELRRVIVEGRSIEEIESVTKQKGLHTLRQDGIEKVKAGHTTLEELSRISL